MTDQPNTTPEIAGAPEDAAAQPPRRTRRPRSLSDKLLELREQHTATIGKLRARAAKLDEEAHRVNAQLVAAEAELARVRLALGEARTNERPDVETTDLQHKEPVGRPHTAEERLDLAPDHDPVSAAQGLNVARFNGAAE